MRLELYLSIEGNHVVPNPFLASMCRFCKVGR